MALHEATPPFNAEGLAAYGETLRGYVRYEVTHHNLEPYVVGPPQQIADIGGGAGIDAVWLASRGHQGQKTAPRFMGQAYPSF